MGLYVNNKLCAVSLPNGKKAPEYTCLNSTGENISAGDKVFIASDSNLKLVTWNAYTSLGYTGIASQNIANGTSGKVSALLKEPVTGLTQWARVDGKATVVGFFTDGNGTKYAVCVADAAYRSNSVWVNQLSIDTPLPNYSSSSDALSATESSTWNMDQIRNNYALSNFPAFNVCYPKTIVYEGVTYHGLLPNAYELEMIWNNRAQLDSLDTTLTEYPLNGLVNWNIGGNGTYVWSSTENNQTHSWYIYKNNNTGSHTWTTSGNRNTTNYGVVPVFEIPVAD